MSGIVILNVMRWARGFLRAWLVLSAVWIGLLVYDWEPKTYSWLWHAPQFTITLPSGHATTFDTSRTHEETVAQVTEELRAEARRSNTSETPESISEKRDRLLTAIDSRYETPGDRARKAWSVTLVPPLFLLVMGLAVAWIASSFRASPTLSN